MDFNAERVKSLQLCANGCGMEDTPWHVCPEDNEVPESEDGVSTTVLGEFSYKTTDCSFFATTSEQPSVKVADFRSMIK